MRTLSPSQTSFPLQNSLILMAEGQEPCGYMPHHGVMKDDKRETPPGVVLAGTPTPTLPSGLLLQGAGHTRCAWQQVYQEI